MSRMTWLDENPSGDLRLVGSLGKEPGSPCHPSNEIK